MSNLRQGRNCWTQKLSLRYKLLVAGATRPGGLGDLIPSLVAQLPAVVDDVVAELRVEWPDYAQFLADDPDSVLERAELALRRLVDLAERGAVEMITAGEQSPQAAALFEELGRIEWREGRPLATLMSAYRAGARAAWRHLSRTALQRGVPAATLALLAEAVFVFVEDLSNASARGYVEEQRASAAEREQLRTELVELLMTERSAASTINAAAARAGWPLPATAALVVVDAQRADAHELLSRLDGACLPVRRPEMTGAVVPDPDGPGRRGRLTEALAGLGAVVSSTVRPSELPLAVTTSVVALRLLRDGVVDDDPFFVSDRYDALLVHRDDRLLELLRAQTLAPLADLSEVGRVRLEETLTAWLIHMGDHRRIAQTLHVHPQTVRYRLGRLRQCFGSALDDPAYRLRLTLALCWQPASARAVPDKRLVSG
jgi:hypothetical protein